MVKLLKNLKNKVLQVKIFKNMINMKKNLQLLIKKENQENMEKILNNIKSQKKLKK